MTEVQWMKDKFNYAFAFALQLKKITENLSNGENC
jgi:hypothetical protein